MKPSPTTSTIGVRTLKNQTSAVLRRVGTGEVVTITDRDEPVAVLMPAARATEEEVLRRLAQTGRLTWSGGKPAGCRNAPATKGPPASEAVIEDRR